MELELRHIEKEENGTRKYKEKYWREHQNLLNDGASMEDHVSKNVDSFARLPFHENTTEAVDTDTVSELQKSLDIVNNYRSWLESMAGQKLSKNIELSK